MPLLLLRRAAPAEGSSCGGQQGLARIDGVGAVDNDEFPVALRAWRAYQRRMETASTPSPLDGVKAQARAAFQLLIKPHTMPFHLAAMALVGVITGIFAVIILLMIMVATNFNVLDFIE